LCDIVFWLYTDINAEDGAGMFLLRYRNRKLHGAITQKITMFPHVAVKTNFSPIPEIPVVQRNLSCRSSADGELRNSSYSHPHMRCRPPFSSVSSLIFEKNYRSCTVKILGQVNVGYYTSVISLSFVENYLWFCMGVKPCLSL
jgi:hypothetical protein